MRKNLIVFLGLGTISFILIIYLFLINPNVANIIDVDSENNQQKAYKAFGLEEEDMGIHYIKLSNLIESERNEALTALKNLKTTGSLSGGIQKTEFDETMIGEAKNNFQALDEDINKAKYKLTFEPVLLDNFYNSKLVGLNSSGILANNKYNIFYQVYDINNGQSVIELTEHYIPKNGSVRLTVIEDFLNDKVNDKPARLESLYSDRQELLYNFSWQNNQRYYELNTKKLSLISVREIANFIDLSSTKIQLLDEKEPN